KTMMIAQQLYEGVEIGEETVGLITYMRTDSTRVSDTAVNEARAYIEKKYGKSFVPASKRQQATQGKNTQDAHEAIRPTSTLREPEMIKPYVTRDQYRLYKLIWERFVASQMAPALLDTMTIDLSNNGIVFRATGSTIKFPGFMKVYVEGSDDNKSEESNLLPDLTENSKVTAEKIEPSQHFTQPPPRYTE